MSGPRIESGSFRDRDGRVFYLDGHVYRGLGERAWEDWRALARTRFFARSVEEGRIVRTVEAELAGDALQSLDESWVGVLRHDRVPFVSYPYEWPFSALRDAARLQLQLVEEALGEDLTLKDASAYNIQWIGSAPTFIDIPSFERRTTEEPWIGYLQFCQLFLYPLLLAAYKGIDYRPWLRGAIDGITPEECRRVMSFRDLLRPGVLAHVHLQARIRERAQGLKQSVRADLGSAGFDRQLILANVRRLRKLVDRLEWKPQGSAWVTYGEDNSYTEEDRRRKEEFVRRAAASRRWRLAWDLGCNTGAYSRVVAEEADYTVAMDADPQVVDRLYRELAAEGHRSILALVNNVADPSPALGWRGRERKSLAERPDPDLIVGLALLHHLVLGANLPLPEVVEWMASFGAHVIVEFVDRTDLMSQRLLLNKVDRFEDHDRGLFEAELGRRFEVLETSELGSGTRTLYFARPRG